MRSLLRSQRGLLAAGAAVLLLVVAGGWFGIISPKRDKAADLEKQVVAAQAELAQKRAELARPSAAVRIRANDLYRLSKALPGSVDAAGVLLDVDRLAKSNKLTFLALTPTAAFAGVGFVQQPYGIELEGRFANVSRFLGDLRRLVVVKKKRLDVRGRVYSIDKVDLAEPNSNLKFPTVKASLTISAFSYVPGAGTPGEPSSSTSSSTGTEAAGATP